MNNNNTKTNISSKQYLDNDLDEFYFQWHITDRCNLRCPHCYQEEYNSKSELSLLDLRKIANQITIALKKWKMKGRIALTGGEPFLKGELFPLMEYLEQDESIWRIGILTNGVLIDQNIINRLKEFKKLYYVQISLDGATKETNDFIRGKGSFEKAIESFRILHKNGIKTRLMYTVHKKNYHEVPSLIDLAIDENITTITIERFVPEGKGAEHKEWFLSKDDIYRLFKEILNRAESEYEKGTPLKIIKYRTLWAMLDPDRTKKSDVPLEIDIGGMCSIGIDSITIMPDGTVLPCRRLPIPIGNLLSDSIFKIWYTSDTLWKIRNKNNLKGKCNKCELIPRCSGCRAIAYAMTGDYLSEDPQCWK
jgi:radical SAM protein with 4Fe4S-binding SPASM domain